MQPLLSEEGMDAMDSGDESDHDLKSTEMLEKNVTEVIPILTLIKDKPDIKYVTVLGKGNWNGKKR